MLKKSITNEQNCLLWQGKKNLGGYGKINYRNKLMQTHRVSWIINNGPISEGLVLRHNCKKQNPEFKIFKECFNVEHLELGTQIENAADEIRDGKKYLGEAHPKSKLTENQVMDIFKSRELISTTERAKKYSVSLATIYNVDHGIAWSHVTGVFGEKKKTNNAKIRSKKYDCVQKNVMMNRFDQYCLGAARQGPFGCLIPKSPSNLQGYSTISINSINRSLFIISIYCLSIGLLFFAAL